MKIEFYFRLTVAHEYAVCGVLDKQRPCGSPTRVRRNEAINKPE
jgi:hypothetical protein